MDIFDPVKYSLEENKFFNEEISNRLMRWRVGVQGAAVALMGLAAILLNI